MASDGVDKHEGKQEKSYEPVLPDRGMLQLAG